MKHVLGLAAVVCAGLSGLATAQTIEPTKTATLQLELPKVTGSIEVRHATARKMQGNEVINDTPVLSVRPTLSADFANGDLNTNFTWIFQRTSGTAEFTKNSKLGMYNETLYNLAVGEVGHTKAYVLVETTDAGNFDTAYVGLENKATTKVATALGALEITGYSIPLVTMHSNSYLDDHKVKARSTGSLSLSEEEAKVKQDTPGYEHWLVANVKLTTAAIPALSFTLGTEIDSAWKPKYVKELVGGDIETSQDGYAVSHLSYNKYTVAYKLSERTTISNQVRQYIGGLYEERINGTDVPRFENRLYLTADLF